MAQTSMTYSSFFDVVKKRHLIDIYYCGLITDDEGTISTDATLSFTYNDKHAINSPQKIKMIPGPFNLAKSTYVEWSPIGGCLLNDLCRARLDPRDDALNLLR